MKGAWATTTKDEERLAERLRLLTQLSAQAGL